MKKTSLLLMLCFWVYSAQSQEAVVDKDIDLRMKLLESSGSQQLNEVKPPVRISSQSTSPVNMVEIANTVYDLQTNSSMQRRIVAHPDGRVSAVWTNSAVGGSFPDRGTGFNHFNGTGWKSVGDVQQRIETIRTGWPMIGTREVNNVAVEYFISHSATVDGATNPEYGGFVFGQNSGIGNEDWNLSRWFVGGPLWPRMATSGDNFYIIASHSDTNVIVGGVKGPDVFFRSTDGGLTWADSNIVLPGYDSTRYRQGRADAYSIDARDSIVVIAIGGTNRDLALWRSEDYGVTWTKTMVNEFPVVWSDWDNVDTIPPTYVNDGSVHVVLDSNNNSHVFYGSRQIFWSDFSAFIPFQPHGLFYWNDITQTEQRLTGIIDENKSDTIQLGEDLSFNTFGRFPNGQYAYLYGGTWTVTNPTAAINDNNGTIYVTYSAVVGFSQATESDPNFRDIYVIYSKDNGATWSIPQNITQNALSSESHFPSVARHTYGNKLHVVWQEDEAPGTVAQDQHASVVNRIMYAGIDLSMIDNNEIGQYGGTVGIEKLSPKNTFSISQNYPNPFSNTTNIDITLTKNDNIRLELIDMMGRIVLTENRNRMEAGKHTITVNGENFSKGIYFYTVTVGDESVTKKMIVK